MDEGAAGLTVRGGEFEEGDQTKDERFRGLAGKKGENLVGKEYRN